MSINVYELAEKSLTPRAVLTNEERDAAEHFDAWAKKIGETGNDPNHEIASFITKTVTDHFYDAPSELLDMMFDRGSIGEFDDYEAMIEPVKNTLVAHEAAKGGNVERSFLDFSVLKPTWKHRQVETDISFADMRRNGWKSVALLTEYATKALENALFYDVFSAVDAGITNGAENYINETTAKPTEATMDALALYINDRAEGGNGVAVALSKYIQAVSKFNSFVSDEMINQVNRTGRLGVYDGVSLYPISGARKLASGGLLIPDKKIFGVAGKIGSLDMKGDVRTYETEDNNKEVVHIKITGFEYGYAFNKDSLENVCKIVIAG